MTHHLTIRGLATLAAAACTLAAPSAHADSVKPDTVEILASNSPLRRYTHAGRVYVEAVKGAPYAIRIRNPYGVRVAVALSVDGLNTIDARQTTATDARKWVLEPYQTVTIRGWQTSRTEARTFEFTSEERSYGAALGKTANLGIISAVFFREKVTPPAPVTDGALERGRAIPTPAPTAPMGTAQDNNAHRASPRAERKETSELAATGMGTRTEHVVTQVWLDLEEQPAHAVNIRYEYRAQLVTLGVLPARIDPLVRRERARGFEPGFAPVPPGVR